MPTAMHNGRMLTRLATATAVVCALGGLAGCGGGNSSAAGPTPSTTPTPTASKTPVDQSTGYLPAPDGVHLTAQGTHLGVGKAAVIAWQPTQKLQGTVRVTVTALDRVSINAFHNWILGPTVKTSTPYYVHATLTNLGKTDLSGKSVPLYALDGHNTLLEASRFQATFDACPSAPLPAKFRKGQVAKVCLVYFAPKHGTVKSVDFRPTQSFDAITWTGHATSHKSGGKGSKKHH